MQRGLLMIAWLVVGAAHGARSIDFDRAGLALDHILRADDFCAFCRLVMVTDKPVYRTGEKVQFTIHAYNLLTKAALTGCRDNRYLNVVVKDASDKEVATLNLDNNSEANDSDDLSTQTVTFQLADSLAGGIYTAEIPGTQKRATATFFVNAFNSQKLGVAGTWSAETVVPGQTLEGELIVKALTSDQETLGIPKIKYQFVDEKSKVLEQKEIDAVGGVAKVSLLLPQGIGKAVTFSATVKAGPYSATYSRQFQAPAYDQIVVDFTFGMGRLVPDELNRIFFQAFSNSERTLSTSIPEARVFLLKGNDVIPLEQDIKTDKNGRGWFDISLKEEDFMTGSTLQFTVKWNELFQTTHKIADLGSTTTSPVLLQLSDTVLDAKDTLRVTVSRHSFQGEVSVVIQDKSIVLHQHLLTFGPSDGRSKSISVPLDSLKFPQGGVLVVQVYTRPVDGRGAEIRASDSQDSSGGEEEKLGQSWVPPNHIEFKGIVQQEALVFVFPKKILKPEVTFDKPVSSPDSEVTFNVGLDTVCPKCVANPSSSTYAVVTVADETAYTQTDAGSHDASMITKIFVQSEVYVNKNHFPFANEYVDAFFSGKEQSEASRALLKNLLGTQSHRQFFFGPTRLQQYVEDRGGEQFQLGRDLFEYLLPDTKGGYGYDSGIRFKRNFGFRGAVNDMVVLEAEPMMMAMDAVAPMAPTEVKVGTAFGGGATPAMMTRRGRVPPPPGFEAANSTASVQENREQDGQGTYTDFLKKDLIFYRKSAKFSGNSIKGSFKLPKYGATFRFHVVVYDDRGNFGQATALVSSRTPIDVAFEAPIYIYSDEVVELPMIFRSNLREPTEFRVEQPLTTTLSLHPRQEHPIKVTLSRRTPSHEVLVLQGDGQEAYRRTFSSMVFTPGILASKGASKYIRGTGSLEEKLGYSEHLPASFVPGSLKGEVCYNNDLMGMIFQTLKQFDKIPTGCFEQMSSTNFPIILALLILQKFPLTSEVIQLRDKLMKTLKDTIPKLLKYRTTDGGFEWFGRDPGHPTLTAYGLLQFELLSQVKGAEGISDPNLKYDLTWFLESQADQEGGFKLGTNGIDSLGNPDKPVADLYILASLLNTLGHNSGRFKREIDKFHTKFEEFRSKRGPHDPYEMLLACFAKLKLQDHNGLSEVISKILARQNEATGAIEGAKTSITRSSGDSLDVETSALALIVLVNFSSATYSKQIGQLIKYLTAKLSSGFYMSTQATILSLVGFYEFFGRLGSKPKSSVVFEVTVNGKSAGEVSVSSDAAFANSTCLDITAALNSVGAAETQVAVEVGAHPKEGRSPDDTQYLFQISMDYRAEKPASAPQSPLRVKTDAHRAGKTRTYQISIHNSQSEPSGMVVYEFAKPSCLSYDLKSLDDLRLSGAVDYFEILESGRNLVFYFRGIGPTSSRSFTVGLTASDPNHQDCKERTHSVYKYYDKGGSAVYVLPDSGIHRPGPDGSDALRPTAMHPSDAKSDGGQPVHTTKLQTEDSV